MSEPLEVSVEGTPNPNAVKFTLNRVVATQGKTYRLPAAPQGLGPSAAQAGDAAGAEMPSWAKALLGIPGVTQVFVINNFISVTKTPGADWNVIVPQAEQMLQQAFA